MLNVIRVPNEWQVLWPSYKKPGGLSGCYLDTMNSAARMGKARRINKGSFIRMFGNKNVYDYYFRWIRGDGWNRL